MLVLLYIENFEILKKARKDKKITDITKIKNKSPKNAFFYY